MIAARQTTGRKRAGRGVLSTLAVMLFASGLIRLGSEAGQALAVESEVTPAGDNAVPATCDPAAGNRALLAAFEDREARITLREGQIDDRLQAMHVAEAEITERLAQLQAAEQALSATLSRADTAAEEDLGQLTAVYENMKAQDAAALFETMEPDFSAGFMGRMRPEIAAAIMAQLEPATAYAISAILAGRNADVPTE